MKILLLTNSFQRINNGPSKFANYVLEMKSITGGEHEVRVATEDVPEGKFGTEGPVYHVPLTFPKWAKPIGQFLRMRLYLNKANEVYKNYPFDALVYINAFNGFYATFQKRHPVFGMVNDAKNVVGNWAHFKPTMGWARLWLFRTLEVAATRRMRMVITNSEYLKQTLLAQYPLDAAKVKRLYKSTESQGIIPKFERDFGEHIKVLFLKTDYRVGALDVVCQALGQLNSYQFELTVVGPVPSAEPVIEEMIVDKPHITLRFLGEQPQDRVREEQNRCDFMCVPSRSG